MSFSAGAITAFLKLDDSGFKNKLNNAQQEVSNFSNSATEGLKSVRNVSAVLTGVMVGVGAVAMSVGKVAGQYESIRDSLGSMTKDMALNIDSFEAGVGKASGGTLDKLTILTNATRALSLMGKDSFTDFGSQFEKLAELSKKASRATGQEVTFMFDSLITGMSRESKMILDNLGITVDLTQAKEDYAKSLGKSTDELTTAESKTAVLNHTIEQLEKNYGAVAVSSGGFSGAMSQWTTEMTNMKIELGQALLPLLTELVRTVTPLAKQYLPMLVDGIGRVVGWFSNLSPNVQKAIFVIGALIPIIGIVAQAILFLIPILTAIATPVGLVVALIVALIAAGVALYMNWDTIRVKATELFDTLTTKIQELYQVYIQPILTAIANAFTWLWYTIIKPIIDMNVAYYMVWYNALKWVWENMLYPILYFIGAVFARIFFEIYSWVKIRIEAVLAVITATMNLLWAFIEPYWDMVYKFLKGIWDSISAYASNVWQRIKTSIVNPVVDAYQNVRLNAEYIKNQVSARFDELLGKVRDTWGKIKDAIVKPFEEAKRKVEEMANQIKEAADKINPFHRESPSLVDNVRAGVDAINRAYQGLDISNSINSNATALGVGVSGAGGVGVSNIVINLDGAIIGDIDQANGIAEQIGNSIIKRLEQNLRI